MTRKERTVQRRVQTRDQALYKLWMGTFTYPTDLYLGGILKVGTLAKDQCTRTHARGLRLERERGAFLESFSIESFYSRYYSVDI